LHEWGKFLGGSRSTGYPRAKTGNSDEPSEEAGSVCASAWTEEAIYTFQLVGVGPLLNPSKSHLSFSQFTPLAFLSMFTEL